MKVGFSGTQIGMTTRQKKLVEYAMRRLKQEGVVEAHHGDCIGADAQFHEICKNLEIKTVIHPPLNRAKRAFCKGDEYREEKDYLLRNNCIVKETDLLIATPKGNEEIRSGTWYTVRQARKLGKRYLVIIP